MGTTRSQTVSTGTRFLVDALRGIKHPLATTADLEPLMEKIGDANYVLLGEASHGTSDYYIWRARLSQRLIQEKGFSFIAVEGDWPDCYRLNCYIKGNNDSESAYDVLHAYRPCHGGFANLQTPCKTLLRYLYLTYNLFVCIDICISKIVLTKLRVRLGYKFSVRE